MRGDDIIHEVEELDAPPALLVRGRHLAGGYFEGGEQRRGTVALVIMAMWSQCRRPWTVMYIRARLFFSLSRVPLVLNST
jgi:hypothetical protein